MNFPITCPLPGEIPSPTLSNCPFKLDQIVRLGFQQRVAASTFANTTALQTLATWQALQAATDDTKIVMSPLFAGFTIPQSEALTSGGNDNSTVHGIRRYHGEGSVTPVGQFSNLQPATKADLMALTQFSLQNPVGLTSLTVYFVNKDGYIYYWEVGGSIFGARVFNFRIGSRGSEGLNSDDINAFGFDLEPNWDNYLKVIKPNFDPLTEL